MNAEEARRGRCQEKRTRSTRRGEEPEGEAGGRASSRTRGRARPGPAPVARPAGPRIPDGRSLKGRPVCAAPRRYRFGGRSGYDRRGAGRYGRAPRRIRSSSEKRDALLPVRKLVRLLGSIEPERQHQPSITAAPTRGSTIAPISGISSDSPTRPAFRAPSIPSRTNPPHGRRTTSTSISDRRSDHLEHRARGKGEIRCGEDEQTEEERRPAARHGPRSRSTGREWKNTGS